MSTQPHTRSSNGCITCKRRRRKCSEEKPACTVCRDRGIECEGYAVRLRWDTGVASRGHLTGADEPVRGRAPVRPKGRLRDLLKQQERAEGTTSSNNDSSTFSLEDGTSFQSPPAQNLFFDSVRMGESEPSAQETHRQTLFDEFLTSGYLALYAGRVDNDSLKPVLPSLCEQSETLSNICIALQAFLSEGLDGSFHEYYDIALARFRLDLSNPAEHMSDAMLMCGLLLCTIGFLCGTPWSLHLKGMEKLLHSRLTLSPSSGIDLSPYAIEAIEVMGVMDLPTFAIGRQSPSLGIWRQYRSGHLLPRSLAADGIEQMSGLPRSLIDLFSAAEDEFSEEAFWLWPGYCGDLLQCHLWEAYRLAGMLDAKRVRYQRDQINPGSQAASFSPASVRTLRLPDHAIIVARLLSALDAIRNRGNQVEEDGMLVMNAIYYPLFTVSLAVLPSEEYAHWHNLVRGWFEYELIRNPSKGMQLAWEVLGDVCQQREQGVSIGADEVARERGLEIGLH